MADDICPFLSQLPEFPQQSSWNEPRLDVSTVLIFSTNRNKLLEASLRIRNVGSVPMIYRIKAPQFWHCPQNYPLGILDPNEVRDELMLTDARNHNTAVEDSHIVVQGTELGPLRTCSKYCLQQFWNQHVPDDLEEHYVEHFMFFSCPAKGSTPTPTVVAPAAVPAVEGIRLKSILKKNGRYNGAQAQEGEGWLRLTWKFLEPGYDALKFLGPSLTAFSLLVFVGTFLAVLIRNWAT